MRETKSICCYCGVGCGVVIEHDGSRITGVRGDPDHPANLGRLCTKGSALHLAARADLRLLAPELRRSRGEPRRRATWDEALELVAGRFAATIGGHGPDAVAFYISGQLLTEDYYVFNKLARALVGTNNIDTNSRLCMSSAVVGYKLALGADAPPACYADIDCAELFLIAGSNTAYAHPVLFRRIEDARARHPRPKLVVIDPRRTDTAAAADLHLAIRPGTDIALFNAMLHVLAAEGLLDRRFIAVHTEGFDALSRTVRDYPPRLAARICGVDADEIVAAARLFGRARAALSLYCQGLNQSTHGAHNNAAIVNLHLATGQIGRPGAGPFSLTGQPNAMGGREVGGMATLLPGHRDPASAEHRAEIAALWGVPGLPARPGKTAVELFEAVAEGEIKALWIACTNPAQSMPHQRVVRAALERAELVVLQEAYRNTETASFADVLLPAASWGEKDGTVTNSERRISRVRAAIAPPGEARADWAIAAEAARRLGRRLGRADAERLFGWRTPAEIFLEHRETTRGRDLDITGLDFAKLERDGPQQWPLPEGAAAGCARLYEDGRFPTASGRARFVDTRHAPPAERADARFPLLLNTGRLRDQWHGMSRTGTVARLYSHAPRPRLAMHPVDLAERGLAAGDIARVTGRRGEIVVAVEASAELQPGHVFLPMHWGGRSMRGAGVNTLTGAAFDPLSKQPELKLAAVEVVKVELPYGVVGLARLDDGLGALDALQRLLDEFAYATLSLFGRDATCVELVAGHPDRVAAPLLAAIDDALGFAGALEGGAGTPSYGDGATERGASERATVESPLAAAPLAESKRPTLRGGTAEARGAPAELTRAPSPAPESHLRPPGVGTAPPSAGTRELRYDDPARGVSKRIGFRDGRLAAARLAGETRAATWLREAMLQGVPDAAARRFAAAPVDRLPVGAPPRGRIVCDCYDVAEEELRRELAAAQSLADLQARLKCGTKCGSCLPELRRLAAPDGTTQAARR
jgi:assimilatory nitrate reductase catalytic subunit